MPLSSPTSGLSQPKGVTSGPGLQVLLLSSSVLKPGAMDTSDYTILVCETEKPNAWWLPHQEP